MVLNDAPGAHTIDPTLYIETVPEQRQEILQGALGG